MAASGAAAAGAETLLLPDPEFRRADQPRLEQAIKRGGLWMSKQQATRRIEAEIFRRLVPEKSSDHVSSNTDRE